MYDVAIIGGGASGITCAIVAKNRGKKVLLIEKEDKLGKKILVTGNGKCNISNVDISTDYYNTKKVAELIKIDVVGFLKNCGIMTKVMDGRIYPYSESALTVVSALRKHLQGVDIVTEKEINKIEKVSDYFIVGGYEAKNIVLASGSNATKGTLSHDLYVAFGHTVTPMRPAIVPLISDVKHTKGMTNLRAKVKISLKKDNKIVYSQNGEVLFKDNGLSGIASMMLSSFIARNGGDYEVVIDFAPDLNSETLDIFLLNNTLDGLLHKAIAQGVSKYALDNGKKESTAVKEFVVKNVKLGKISNAQVVCGGLNFDEFDENLQSKIQPKLYACGEVLDVDGDCGGYNLHFALASGIRVGNAIC